MDFLGLFFGLFPEISHHHKENQVYFKKKFAFLRFGFILSCKGEYHGGRTEKQFFQTQR